MIHKSYDYLKYNSYDFSSPFLDGLNICVGVLTGYSRPLSANPDIFFFCTLASLYFFPSLCVSCKSSVIAIPVLTSRCAHHVLYFSIKWYNVYHIVTCFSTLIFRTCLISYLLIGIFQTLKSFFVDYLFIMRYNHDKNDGVPLNNIHSNLHNNMPLSGYSAFDSIPQSQITIVNNMMYYQGIFFLYLV